MRCWSRAASRRASRASRTRRFAFLRRARAGNEVRPRAADLRAAHRPAVEANRQELARAEADLRALRARVVRDMRQAYYQWLATQQAVVVLEATLELARPTSTRTRACTATAGSRATSSIAPRRTSSRSSSSDLAAASRVRHLAELRQPAAQRAARRRRCRSCRDRRRQPIERFRARFAERAGGPTPRARSSCRTSPRIDAQELAGLDAAIAAGEAQQDLARAAFKPRLALGAEAGIQGDGLRHRRGGSLRARLAGAALERVSRRGGPGGAARGEAR